MFGRSSLDHGMILLKEFSSRFIKNTNAFSRTSQPTKSTKKAPQPAGEGSLGELKNFGIVERHWEIVGFFFRDVSNNVGHLVIQRKRLGSLELKLKQGELLGDLIE